MFRIAIRRYVAITLLFFIPLSSYAQTSPKVFRYAFPIAETGFDPAQISDAYSHRVVTAILESLLQFDHLARPAKIVPNLASELPQVSADFKTITFKIKKGIYFADDPAFKGIKRELTAEDVIYSFKRHYDPKLKSYAINTLQSSKVLGLNALRTQAIKNKTPFPYDTEVEGARALDRYTVQFKLEDPAPRFHEIFTDPSLYGVVAREVVEFYGDKIMEHPVGTGPFKLGEWRRSSKIVLLKSPEYREVLYEAEPQAEDQEAQAFYQKLKGKRLPFVDRIEISIIEEQQPRWLAFLNEEHDFLEQLPNDFAPIAIPNNELAPHLKKRGIGFSRQAAPDIRITYFNMEDPVVGGYTPEKVALRRAISLAINIEEEIRLAHRNQAIAAQSLLPPMTTGYDPMFKSEMGEFNPARAKALLELYGYKDRDKDGWRELPDGKPLQLVCASQPDQVTRQLDELFKKNMAAVGIKVDFKPAKWPQNLKSARAGKLQMWRLGFSATEADPYSFLQLAYGPAKGETNLARFDLPAYDALYNQQKTLPNGPERLALMAQARNITLAYLPYKAHVHRILNDLTHPWVIGYKRHPFARDFFKYLDIDESKRRSK
ncbi:MAG: bicyclomycin resistance protein [Burkholderiaceae bacterium]|nr:bicyclomycin resistance protein [Burkholderiaceae bacterium]